MFPYMETHNSSPLFTQTNLANNARANIGYQNITHPVCYCSHPSREGIFILFHMIWAAIINDCPLIASKYYLNISKS
jgi:hypothetical protein